MAKIYFKLNKDNIIIDATEFPTEGYVEYETDEVPLPAGINGGWWEFTDGQLIEHPELKPQQTPLEEEIDLLKAELNEIKKRLEMYENAQN